MQILQGDRSENCAVNCVDTIEIFTQVHVSIHSGMQRLLIWGSKLSSRH